MVGSWLVQVGRYSGSPLPFITSVPQFLMGLHGHRTLPQLQRTAELGSQYDSMESKTCWLSNENPPCYHCSCIYVPQSSSASLAKSGRGWEGCWPHAHLGTCWENFAHAAKCPVALRTSIYILNYPEIQPHGPSACLDQCLMAAGVRNLLCSNSP